MIQLIGQRAALSGFMILLEDPLEENIEEWILKKKKSLAHISFSIRAQTPAHGRSPLRT